MFHPDSCFISLLGSIHLFCIHACVNDMFQSIVWFWVWPVCSPLKAFLFGQRFFHTCSCGTYLYCHQSLLCGRLLSVVVMRRKRNREKKPKGGPGEGAKPNHATVSLTLNKLHRHVQHALVLTGNWPLDWFNYARRRDQDWLSEWVKKIIGFLFAKTANENWLESSADTAVTKIANTSYMCSRKQSAWTQYLQFGPISSTWSQGRPTIQ